MTDASVRVAAVPVGPAGTDPAALWGEVEAGLARVAADGVALAVLPELTLLPSVAGDDPARWRHLAETREGPTATHMRALARRHGIAIVFGMALAEPEGGLPLNAAMLARADGRLTGLAAKQRLPPPLPGDAYGEAQHFRAGSPGSVARVGDLRVAALVCFDRRFPEAWDRAAAGADLVAVLVAGPAPQDPPGHFRAELAGHARRCAVPAVAAARYGVEHVLGRPVRHDGESLVLDRAGRVLAQGTADAPGPAVAAIPAFRGAASLLPTA